MAHCEVIVDQHHVTGFQRAFDDLYKIVVAHTRFHIEPLGPIVIADLKDDLALVSRNDGKLRYQQFIIKYFGIDINLGEHAGSDTRIFMINANNGLNCAFFFVDGGVNGLDTSRNPIQVRQRGKADAGRAAFVNLAKFRFEHLRLDNQLVQSNNPTNFNPHAHLLTLGSLDFENPAVEGRFDLAFLQGKPGLFTSKFGRIQKLGTEYLMLLVTGADILEVQVLFLLFVILLADQLHVVLFLQAHHQYLDHYH